MTTAKDEYHEQVRKIRRDNVSDMKVEFYGGTDVKTACGIMYDLHAETNCTVTAYFNDVRIELMSRKSAEIYGRDK